MIIGNFVGRRPLGPVVAQIRQRRIGFRSILVIPADGVGNALRAAILSPVCLPVIVVVRDGRGSVAGIYRIGSAFLGRVSDGNLAFQVVVDELAGGKIGVGVVGNGNLRAAVRRHNPAVTGAADVTCQVDLAPLGFNILHHQTPALRIIVNLGHILIDAGGVFIDRLVTVVDLVHGLALDRNLAAVVLQHLDVLVAQSLELNLVALIVSIGNNFAIFIPDIFVNFRHILGIAALNQAVDIDGIRRNVHTVARNAAGVIVGASHIVR